MRELTDPELALCRKDKGRAVELKGQGNACFSRREFGEALRFYSQVSASSLKHVNLLFTSVGGNYITAVKIE